MDIDKMSQFQTQVNKIHYSEKFVLFDHNDLRHDISSLRWIVFVLS